MSFHLLVDIGELGVPIGVLLALHRLGCPLQAEPVLSQQPAHGRSRNRMALSGQLLGQMPQRLGRPAQRRHRIPALIQFHQPEEGSSELTALLVGTLAPTAGPARSPHRQRLLTGLQLCHALAHGRGAGSGRLRDRADPPVPEQPGLGRQRQSLLAFVPMRQQHLEPSGELAADLGVDPPTTSSAIPPTNHNLLLYASGTSRTGATSSSCSRWADRDRRWTMPRSRPSTPPSPSGCCGWRPSRPSPPPGAGSPPGSTSTTGNVAIPRSRCAAHSSSSTRIAAAATPPSPAATASRRPRRCQGQALRAAFGRP